MPHPSLTSKSEPKNLSQEAFSALKSLARTFPKAFLTTMSQELPRLDQNPAYAVKVMGLVVGSYPVEFQPYLSATVENVVRSLDPHLPALRDACQQEALRSLSLFFFFSEIEFRYGSPFLPFIPSGFLVFVTVQFTVVIFPTRF